MAPFFSMGRVFSSIFLFPVRVWRSVVHRPREDQRRREDLEERQFDERQIGAFTRPAEDARDLLRRTRP